MSQTLLQELLEKADKLTAEERLKLINYLAKNLKFGYQFIENSRPSWRKIRGILKEPLEGEDAQQWVSRNRREGDEHRERVLRSKS